MGEKTNEEMIEKTKAEFLRTANTNLTTVEAEEVIENLKNFFDLLFDWTENADYDSNSS